MSLTPLKYLYTCEPQTSKFLPTAAFFYACRYFDSGLACSHLIQLPTTLQVTLRLRLCYRLGIVIIQKQGKKSFFVERKLAESCVVRGIESPVPIGA